MIAQAITFAQQFGEALVKAYYNTAYTYLSLDLQQQYSTQSLQQTVETMITYGSGPILRVIAMTDCLLTESGRPHTKLNDFLLKRKRLLSNGFSKCNLLESRKFQCH